MIKKKHITLCFSLFLALSMFLGQLIPVTAEDNPVPAEDQTTETAEPTPEETPEETEDVPDPVPDTVPTEDGEGNGEADLTVPEEEPAETVPGGEEQAPEEGESRIFTAEKDGASVTVAAKDAGLPEKTTLKVAELTKESEDPEVVQKYEEAEAKVGADLTEEESFLAYDICFKDENGEEIEPAEGSQITVTLNIQRNKFPDNLKEDSVAIQHLEETPAGIEVNPVASANDTVNVGSTLVESKFNVDSFSTFTATYAVARASLPDNLTISLEDKVTENGRIEANVTGIPEGVKATYTWYKDGVEVSREANGIENGENIYTIDKDPENATWVNVVAAKGLTSTYYVKVTLEADGVEKEYTSESKPIEYYDSIRNGDFGTPAFTGHQHNVKSGEEGVVWKTTASDDEIELVHNHTGETTHFHGPDNDGNSQWAELNANESGSLYQDVITLPGSTLTWSFAHRARGTKPNETLYEWDWSSFPPKKVEKPENDSMYLLITSTKIAEDEQLTSQDKVLQFINKVRSDENSYPGVRIVPVTDGKEWTVHSGGYPVLDGQYQTRFYFVAGTTASKDETIGNYIDSVRFGQDIPEPLPGKAGLYLYKTFGSESEVTISDIKTDIHTDRQYNPLRFQIDYENGNSEVVDVDGTGTYIKALDYEGKVTITELYGDNSLNEGSHIDGYDLSTKVRSNDGDWSGNTVNSNSSIIVDLKRDSNTSVYFENTYKKEKTTLTIKKEVNGNMGDRDRDFDYYLMLKDENGNYAELPEDHEWLTKNSSSDNPTTYSFKLHHGDTKTLSLPVGYTVELYKKDVTNEGYTAPAVTYWTNSTELPTEQNPDTLEVKKENEHHKAISNKITEPSTVKIAISKEAQVPSGLSDHDSYLSAFMLSAGTVIILLAMIIGVRRRMSAH